jgi:hypothetical protein
MGVTYSGNARNFVKKNRVFVKIDLSLENWSDLDSRPIAR